MNTIPHEWLLKRPRYYDFDLAEVLKTFPRSEFLEEVQIKQADGEWTSRPVAVFKQYSKDGEYYFGLFRKIYDTTSQFYCEIHDLDYLVPAITCEDTGETLFSRHKSDLVHSSDHVAFITGGRGSPKASIPKPWKKCHYNIVDKVVHPTEWKENGSDQV